VLRAVKGRAFFNFYRGGKRSKTRPGRAFEGFARRKKAFFIDFFA
jgi:hypothetical protein